MKTLAEIVQELPPELQQEVHDFAQWLAETRTYPKRTRLRQDWAGALRDLRGQYTSVELQHKALEWRGD
ncbi:DUF2281 domain-containing protein [Candidatus Fermentibacteria bacterium]|nr:DUF2281 domain-containing protein [Candidatus Fermentibacteria bacterium]